MHHIRFKSIPTDKVAIHPLFEREHHDDDNGTQWFCPKVSKDQIVVEGDDIQMATITLKPGQTIGTRGGALVYLTD